MLLLGWAVGAWAQAVVAPAAAASASAVTSPPRDRMTPTLTVVEDDGVRIEEKRLLGQVQRITVQHLDVIPKNAGGKAPLIKAYRAPSTITA